MVLGTLSRKDFIGVAPVIQVTSLNAEDRGADLGGIQGHERNRG